MWKSKDLYLKIDQVSPSKYSTIIKKISSSRKFRNHKNLFKLHIPNNNAKKGTLCFLAGSSVQSMIPLRHPTASSLVPQGRQVKQDIPRCPEIIKTVD